LKTYAILHRDLVTRLGEATLGKYFIRDALITGSTTALIGAQSRRWLSVNLNSNISALTRGNNKERNVRAYETQSGLIIVDLMTLKYYLRK
jgi:hypothetical protein